MANSVSSSYSYLQTTGNRFTGLASGMDIDAMVEKLMKAESAKMEKLQQQKQTYEWQRDAYRGVNSKLEAFRTELFDNYALSSNYLSKKVSVSDSSKVSVSAGSSASGNLTITSATIAKNALALADNANFVGKTGENTLSEIGITGDGAVALRVINDQGKAVDKVIEYNQDETIDSFISKLNSAGVTATFAGGKMSISANSTGTMAGGAMQVIDIADANPEVAYTGGRTDSQSIFQKLGFLSSGPVGSLVSGADDVEGTNASYTINGITMNSTSNTFNQSGYSITLKQSFTDGNVVISSTTDTDVIVDKVKSFVELYNGLIESLKGQISEKKRYDYKPLTDAQKAEMSEEDIEKWEEQAKKGLLRNDSAISKALSDMRTGIYDVETDLDSKFNTLFNIGITTSFEDRTSGKLSIDEDKLRKAIEENPNAVANLFTKGEVKDETGKIVEKGGIVAQLRTASKTAIDSIEEKAGKISSGENTYTLGKNIISVNKSIEDWKERLKKTEERYYKQFAAMENAINKANSQSSLFMQ